MSIRTTLIALAGAGAAFAQKSCTATATVTLENNSDATALSGCKTFSGSVAVATGFTGSLEISGVQKLDGTLSVSNVPNITSLTLSSMNEITQDFVLENVQGMTQLAAPSLKTVGQNIKWIALAGIQSVNVGPITKADSIDIENTKLQNLDSINLVSVTNYVVSNNPFLQKIESQLGNVTNRLEISGNSKPTVSFPNLIWATNMTFIACSSVSLPSITTINGSMALSENTFTDFQAPNLTKVGADASKGGSLAFIHNDQLTNLSLPALTYIGGGFNLANNTKLTEVDQVPQLATVTGALDFFGNMANISLPALNLVAGDFNIQSTEDITNDCNVFSKLVNQKIRGKYVCAGKQATPAGVGSTPTGSSSSSSGKPNAAGHVTFSVPAVVSVSGALALIASLL